MIEIYVEFQLIFKKEIVKNPNMRPINIES